MSNAPRQPPPKKEVALALLDESSMFIHLDPRRPDVAVPKGFMGQPQLVLQVGHNTAIPIPDLKVDDGGISCTLYFNRAPFWCNIPWHAIYALVGEDGRGGVWPDDVPPEIQLQQRSSGPQRQPPPKRPRPKLSAVGSPDEARDEPEVVAPPAGPRAIAEEEPKRPTPLRRGPTAVPAPPPRAEASEDSVKDDEAAEPEPSPNRVGKKPKREIPPYLRVIK